MVKYLVQDIETIPETEIQKSWEEEKITLQDKGKPKDFPPIQFHKVICIGMLALDERFNVVKGGCAAGGLVSDKGEKKMLERWSELASGRMWEQRDPLRLVDWHGRGFDVPVMQTRCFRYGIQLPWYFGLLRDNKGGISQWSKEYRDRYTGWHIDLADLWSNKGAFARPHMANLAQLMGLPGKVGIDGSKVHEAYLEKRYEEIDVYCMQDVIQTAFIFQRWQHLTGRINLDWYREAATSLLDWTKGLSEQKEFFDKIDRAALLLE